MILFLNHKTTNCGVYQLGKRIGNALQDCRKYDVLYCELDSQLEFENLVTSYNPKVVVYNFYPSTMPWVSHKLLDQYRSRIVHVAIFHEVPITGFDYLIHIDPTFIEHNNNFNIGRLIPEYTNNFPVPEIMTVGSFGFGLGGKNYHTLVRKVNDEFDEAVINLHIPFAYYGDQDGKGAMWWANLCRDSVTKPGIKLNITHEFLQEDELLDFLARNTINAFYYDDMYGRGCASVIDYALAVGRPMAITRSYMFRHIHPYAPWICMEDNRLRDIAAGGTSPLTQFMHWNKENLISKFEGIYDSIKNARGI